MRKLSADYTKAQGLVARAYYQLGREAYARQDWDRALTCLEKVTRSCPDYQDARSLESAVRFELARLAYERGEQTEALRQLELVKRDWERYGEAQRLLEQVKGGGGSAAGVVE